MVRSFYSCVSDAALLGGRRLTQARDRRAESHGQNYDRAVLDFSFFFRAYSEILRMTYPFMTNKENNSCRNH